MQSLTTNTRPATITTCTQIHTYIHAPVCSSANIGEDSQKQTRQDLANKIHIQQHQNKTLAEPKECSLALGLDFLQKWVVNVTVHLVRGVECALQPNGAQARKHELS